ncbi:organic solute transporter ostalpha protein (DUF300) isoform X3 [Tasmannia lanceolata]|uniref:organic solute transporter ostalpha protein (DUF300) isoform X3 n=1 Tax=Tasmannia lanceolata TaxID=3420 RepID=UPI0040633027
MAASRIVYDQGIFGDFHSLAVIIGGIFALVAVVLSILLILQHLRSYNNPAEQKWIVGVVFMVPVYASESLLSLWKPRFSIVCDILRNCYEAFALYCFGRYLVACLGGEESVIQMLEDESRKQLSKPLLQGENNIGATRKPSFLDFFCRLRVLGKDLYTIVKFGIVQYMILKMLCAFLALLLELFGVYGDGKFKWHYGYPYIAVVLNFSHMWALYCLVQFYNVTHHRSQSIRPLAKFVSFKAIVFATWWQGVGIALLCSLGVLSKEERFQKQIQDFLICIEMAIAAVAHLFVFSAKPYRFMPRPEQVTTQATKATLTLEEDGEDKPAVVQQAETQLKAPRTSVRESVQDIVIGGGEHVVKDVVLTITKAIEPVEKGVTKIQKTFHHVSLGGSKQEEEGPKVEIDELVEENVTESGSHVSRSEDNVMSEFSGGD